MRNFKRALCVVMSFVIFWLSFASSCASVYAAETDAFDESVSAAESVGVESSEAESAEVVFSESGTSEVESSEVESSVFESVSEVISVSVEEDMETVLELDLSEYDIDSFEEGIAPQADLGLGIALAKIFQDLIVAAGVNALGYTGSDQLSKNSDAFNSLQRAILSSPLVASAVDSVRAASDGDLYTLSAAGPVFLDNLRIEAVPGGKTVKLGLNAALILAAKAAAKEWADSEANNFDYVSVSDYKAGTVQVSSQYMDSITTNYRPSLNNISSVSDLNSFFSIDGISEYLVSHGYSDSSHYFLIDSSSPSVYVYVIPLSYSLVGFVYSGARNVYTLLSSNDYNLLVSKYGSLDASGFSAYVNSLRLNLGIDCFVFSRSGSVSVFRSCSSDRVTSFLSSGSYSSSFYTCNYLKAFAAGSIIGFTTFARDMIRYFYGCNTVSNYLTYDDVKAPAIPADGYVDYNIGEDDYSGIDYADFAALQKRLADIESKADEADKKQDEVIDQNKGILGFLSDIQQLIKTISVTVGNSGSMISLIYAAIVGLAASVASAMVDALTESLSAEGTLSNLLSIPIENAWTRTISPALAKLLVGVFPYVPLEDAWSRTIYPNMAKLLTNDLVGALVGVFPYVPLEDSWRGFIYPNLLKALEDAHSKAPAIEIPDIAIPPIAIPDIKVPPVVIPEGLLSPTITLNPDITVANDYTGLEGIISRAIEASLTKLFVPDEALALQKVGAMCEYFEFKDEIYVYVDTMKTFLSGITPSPFLKVPIGSVSSGKFKGLFGDYFIIDISWYGRYKQFGDKLIIAVAWSLFLWRLYLKLPGIISGAEGSIMAANNSYQRYRKG